MLLDNTTHSVQPQDHSALYDAAAAFDSLAYAYKGRPLYPEKAMRAILAHIDRGSNLLDIGAGEGRTLESFERVTPLNYFKRIIAVEPSRNMRDVLRRSFTNVSNLEYFDGTFNETRLPNQSVNTVSFGSCIHWATATREDAQRAFQETARVLAPDGKVVILSDSWSTANEVSFKLSQIEERCVAKFKPHENLHANDNVAKKSSFEFSEVISFARTLLMPKSKRRQLEQAHLRDRLRDKFIKNNGLEGFLDEPSIEVFTEAMSLSPDQICAEFESHAHFNALPVNEQADVLRDINALTKEHMNDNGTVTCQRACLVMVGKLAR